MSTTASLEWNYLDFFERAFDLRKQRNTRYSRRAFARDLGISAGFLSSLSQGKVGLSVDLAKKLVPKLKLSKEEKAAFLIMVSSRHHRSNTVRRLSQRSLASLKRDLQLQPLNDDYAKLAHSWIASALLTLVDHHEFSSDPVWMARQLSISQSEAETTWGVLLKLKLVAKGGDGQWRRSSRNFISRAESTNKDFQSQYRQMMAKAEKTLSDSPTSQRVFSNCFLSMSEDDYDYANQSISEFLNQLAIDIAKRGGKSDRIYCLSTQLFPISQVPPTPSGDK